MSLAEAIKHEARAVGFDVVGISRVHPKADVPASGIDTSDLEPRPSSRDVLYARLLAWLERGYHATMSWMGRDPAKRADPRLVLPGCRSIVSVGLNYYTGHRAEERPGYGRIARYAWGTDYHRVFQDRLARLEDRIATLVPAAATRSYVDTGPIMEKAWAQRAGLGWIGKHSNLVSAEYGSWLLLGEVLTTLDLDEDEPGTDLCGSCTLCIKACPTGAIVEPYILDARRCISYLTIEFRGTASEIDPDLASRMGNRIFGCDDCLDVCPFNLRAEPTGEPAFQPRPLSLSPALGGIAAMSDHEFAAAFAGSPVRRAKRSGLQRNAAIASGQPSRQVLFSPGGH